MSELFMAISKISKQSFKLATTKIHFRQQSLFLYNYFS